MSKNNNEEKMLIGYDYEAELIYKNTLRDKSIAKDNLYKYVVDICKIPISEEELLNGSILDNFESAFKLKWESKLPEEITLERKLFLASIDTKKLHSYVKAYEEIKLPESSNFGIYAKTEDQIKKYRKLLHICQAVHEAEDLGIHVFKGQIINAFNNAIRYDAKLNKLAPNHYYVLQMLR